MAKICDYCLSESHPRGRHKACVFLSALGMTTAHSEEPRTALIVAAQEKDAALGTSDRYGTRYIIDFKLRRSERSATIRSSLIVRNDETSPRFATCFVL
jgi:hypothetical protein